MPRLDPHDLVFDTTAIVSGGLHETVEAAAGRSTAAAMRRILAEARDA